MQPADVRAREAALFLHGLPKPQRQQVLDRLETEHRRKLEPLLVELSALGLPTTLPNRIERDPPKRNGTTREQVAELHPRHAAAALRQRSSATAAAVLKTQDESWAKAVLGRLTRDRRARVAEHSRADWPALPPKVVDLLCARLVHEVRASTSKRRERAIDPRARIKEWLQWTR